MTIGRLAVLCLLALASSSRAQVLPDEVQKKMAAAVVRMRTAGLGDGGQEFERAKSKLLDELLLARRQGILPSTAPVNGIVGAVLDIYAVRRRSGAVDADGRFPIMLAAQYANSPKAKTFLLGLLARAPGRDGEAAVEDLAFSDVWTGDAALLTALQKLSRREEDHSVMPAAAMQKLDPARALPEILHLLETTGNPVIYYKSAGLLSNYHRLDLIQRAYHRAGAMSAARGDFPIGLLDATDPELMWKCLAECPAAELTPALTALPEMRKARRGEGGRTAREILQRRLKDEKDPALRKEIEAALAFLLE